MGGLAEGYPQTPPYAWWNWHDEPQRRTPNIADDYAASTMRLLRFDPEVSIPVESFGSRFRVGPLTGDGSRVRVQIIHIGPTA